MTDYAPGDFVYIDTTDYGSCGRKPSWMSWTSKNRIAGTAKLPSGHRRVCFVTDNAPRETADINVTPISLPASSAPWRCAVYKPGGAYIVMDGLTGIPTIGTPVVRLQADGPARAVVQIPLSPGTDNVLSTSFDGWSDGSTGKIERGMEMTVEFRDAATSSLVMVFRGIVYQVESGETVTLTAYDRLMDLVQFSDQYQSTAGHQTEVTSYNRSESGSTLTFDMGQEVGTVDSCTAISRVTIDAVSSMGGSGEYYSVAHQLPYVGSVTPGAGSSISHLKTSVRATFMSGGATSHLETVMAVFYLLEKTSSGLVVRATSSQVGSAQLSTSAVMHYMSATLETDVSGWTIGDTPSNWYIGVGTWATSADGRACYSVVNDSTTRYTTANLSYYKYDGSSWVALSDSNLPEIAVTFTYNVGAVSTSALTVSGSSVSLDKSAIPDVTGTYLSVDTKGVGIVLSYYVTDSAPIAGIVEDLLTWAGLTPDVDSSVNMGNTTYYTTSTYDYLTCVNELIRASNCMAVADISEAGKIHVRPKHTIDEAAILDASTDPSSSAQIILSHKLTAHWMAEKATVAYMAEDTTTSGLPVALETDDALMDNSLSAAFPAPLRQVIADRSLGTHTLQANAAGGKMVQLHTNVFEGSVVLAGYRTNLWSSDSSKVGGAPISVDVPEAGVNGVAIPTQIILHDGITEVSLDNIRTADRSEVANSMGLAADAISNGSGELPDTVYIFARVDSNAAETGLSYSDLTYISLVTTDGSSFAQSTAAYLKYTYDKAGYMHYCAVFPAADAPASGYAPNYDIALVRIQRASGYSYAVLDNPKRALGGQAIHVDIRVKLYV